MTNKMLETISAFIVSSTLANSNYIAFVSNPFFARDSERSRFLTFFSSNNISWVLRLRVLLKQMSYYPAFFYRWLWLVIEKLICQAIRVRPAPMRGTLIDIYVDVSKVNQQQAFQNSYMPGIGSYFNSRGIEVSYLGLES